MSPSKIMNSLLVFAVSLLVSGSMAATAAQGIAPNDTRITVKGCQFVERTVEALSFARFPAEHAAMDARDLGYNPEKAAATSGVRLLFATDSSEVTLHFTTPMLPLNRGADFAVFSEGRLIKEFTFNKSQSAAVALSFDAPDAGIHAYEVTLPSYASPHFKGMELDTGAALETYAYDKPIYVAIGDSISHGVGQRSATHLTWPFLLSQTMDWDLYNLAVGGGKISVPVAEQLAGLEQVDVMTILVGYNDWCFNGKSPEVFAADYHRFLDTVRGNHPETKIYCISMLYTRQAVSKKTGEPIEPMRQAVAEVVAKRQADGDSNIFFIQGDAISSEANLRGDDAPTDPVHLGIPGARLFAESMHQAINELQ